MEDNNADEFEPGIMPAEEEGAPDNDEVNRIELDGCGGSCFCHPQKLCHKLIALVLMCLLSFGSYFCFDNPGALQDEIKNVMDVSTYEFAKLYAWYSWPNVALPIIGGYLLDTIFGIRFGASFFAFILIIGQGLFALGGYTQSFVLMEVGRFFFGIGGESLAVAQNTYASAWFSGKALNMVFGLQLSIARLGSTVNFQVVGPVFRALDGEEQSGVWALGTTLMIAGITCVISFVCAVVLGILDKRAERILHQNHLIESPSSFGFRDILSFPLRFWLLCIICVTYYVAIFPFVSLGQVFFMKKFAMSKGSANFINGLIYLISSFASPFCGFIIDRVGRNLAFVFISIATSLLGHCLLAFSFIDPYVAVLTLAFSYSMLASSLWPLITFVIPQEQLGTAFGLMQAVQNLGLAVIALVAGLIVDEDGYLWLEMFFITWLSIALSCTGIVWVLDTKGNGALNMSAKERSNLGKVLSKEQLNSSQENDFDELLD